MNKRHVKSTMKGQASLAVERLTASQEPAAVLEAEKVSNEDSFDMSLLEQATALVEEPFPTIAWNSLDSYQDGYHRTAEQRKKLLFMSPQVRRLKRRRRGFGHGYLVRCSEVLESVLLINDGTTLEDVDNGDEHQLAALKNQTPHRRTKKSKRHVSNDSSDSSTTHYFWDTDENSPDPFPP
jgi:hypothetical protein